MILPRRHAAVAALAGTVVGMLAAAALVASGSLERAPAQVQPIEELLAAYRRSREGTYVVEATFTRTMPDGRQLGSAALVVQRPPDSLRRQLGSVTGTLQGRSLNCTSATDGRLRCAPTGEVRPWQEQVDRDVEVLRSYFDRAHPLYRVRRDGEGCFVLDQDRPFPDPTYGARSRMCFDPTTGAMTLLELTRETGVVDRFEAATVRGDVSDADLRVEADQAYDARDEAGNLVGGLPGG